MSAATPNAQSWLSPAFSPNPDFLASIRSGRACVLGCRRVSAVFPFLGSHKNWTILRKIRRVIDEQRCLFAFKPEGKMNSSAQPKRKAVRATEEVIFEFQNLEITRNALVIRFFEETTIIPLKDIASYHFKWYLHDPIFAKKWWFLVLTVTLKNGDVESGHVTAVKFNYLSDDSELRRDIETKISRAIETALSWASVPAKDDSSLATSDQPGSSGERSNECK